MIQRARATHIYIEGSPSRRRRRIQFICLAPWLVIRLYSCWYAIVWLTAERRYKAIVRWSFPLYDSFSVTGNGNDRKLIQHRCELWKEMKCAKDKQLHSVPRVRRAPVIRQIEASEINQNAAAKLFIFAIFPDEQWEECVYVSHLTCVSFRIASCLWASAERGGRRTESVLHFARAIKTFVDYMQAAAEEEGSCPPLREHFHTPSVVHPAAASVHTSPLSSMLRPLYLMRVSSFILFQFHHRRILAFYMPAKEPNHNTTDSFASKRAHTDSG